jgi:Raf kinase inhibitor-like YbhB/YbcL family protein
MWSDTSATAGARLIGVNWTRRLRHAGRGGPRRPRLAASLALCVVGLAACSGRGVSRVEPDLADTIEVSSSAFADGAAIPVRFTCEGENLSPPLAWSRAPANTAELALVVDDPDAPGGTYVHWVVYHLGADVMSVGEGALPSGARQAKNSKGDSSYAGPCPPPGPAHHYRFTVYALREPLAIADRAELKPALAAIDRTVSARGRLVGTFARG